MKCDRFIIRLKSSFRLRVYTFNYRKVKIELRLSIADTLPVAQVVATKFPLHISYFLQKCKQDSCL